MNCTLKLFNRAFLVFALLSLTELVFCAQSANRQAHFLEKPTSVLSPQDIGLVEGQRYVVDKDIDLQGKLCKIPNDVILVFKGGKFKNGELFGQNTRI